MPFITEELWQFMRNDTEVESIVSAKWPDTKESDKNCVKGFASSTEVIAGIRTIRQEKNLPMKEKLNLHIILHGDYDNRFDSVIKKLGNLETIQFVEEKPVLAAGFIVKSHEYFIPLGTMVNKEEEIKKLQDELKYAEGFLKSVMAKLSNEKFVKNAPPTVIENERKKQADAESKITILKEQIAGLKG